MPPIGKLPYPRTFLAGAVLLSAYSLFTLYRYGAFAGYMDHGEPTVAIRSWQLAMGQDIYAQPRSDSFLMVLYGPVTFIINGLYLALFGASIFTSKIGALAASALSAGLFALYAVRRYGTSHMGLGLLLFVCIQLFAMPFSFWNRPEPHTILLVTVALLSTTLGEVRKYLPPLIIAVCIGLAVNIKIHSFIYFLPIVFISCSERCRLTYPLMAALSLLVLLVPFASSNISLVEYLGGVFRVAGEHSFLPGTAAGSLKKGILFLSPGLVLAALLAVGKRPPISDTLYFAALSLSMGLALYLVAVTGGSWNQYLPFFPITVDAFLRFTGRLEERPRTQKAIVFIFALTFLILTVTPQKRLHRRLNDRAWMSAAAAEVEGILKRHPGVPVEMGYGDSLTRGYEITYLKPILAFAGNPVTIDGWSDMEANHTGLPMGRGKRDRLRACKTRIWLVPKGQAPFKLKSYYGGRIYGREFRQAFLANHDPGEQLEFFDLWRCR